MTDSLFICPDPEREQSEMYAELAQMGFSESAPSDRNRPAPRAEQVWSAE
jgi:hypothetical protein